MSQLSLLASSHSSEPQTSPSPQPVMLVQALEQVSQLSLLASSHSSKSAGLPGLLRVWPSPQVATTQPATQSSVSSELLSSHSSPASGFHTSSGQAGKVQS